MTVNMSILNPNSNLTQSKVYYSNARHQFCINWALISLRAIVHLRKNPKRCKNWCVFSQHVPNEILLIHQILNSSKFWSFGDKWHQFYIKPPSIALRHFRKHSKRGNKSEQLIVNVSIFHQISGVTATKIDYSYTRHHPHFL